MSGLKKAEKREWYVNIFNDMGADWEAIVNVRDTQKEASFIESVINTKGVTLDLCCGTGRHAIVMRRKGLDIVGMDLSKNLLAIAKQRMRDAGVTFPIVRADMRHLPFKDEAFKAIINMFTSFGYLPSKSEDMKSLSEVNRTLRKNGRFLLDLSNRDHMVKNFRERDWAEFEPFYLVEKRSIDLQSSKLTSQWILIQKGTGKIKSELHELRLYTLTQIEPMLTKARLRVRDVYGGYEKQVFCSENSRMIVLAQKR